ncbi:DUF6891 domain-containing protein [Plantactinospora soyae]|uniref:DUF6891 domain-containing protein n=1 Tax=Plantactinospora soyae TaxID=1544732 RepID=A0A927MER3_9ACTN|nr:hypothetical protein [Plantactinospora soyae]MBE1492320.1 hypothetical protein [Plantactinospora soyae]
MESGNGQDTLREQVETYVRLQVAIGERPYAAIVDGAVEYLDDVEDEETVEALAREVAAVEFAAHATAQAQWPEVSDADRLTLAFRALDVAGIVAREAFTCCQNCGLAEIGAEVADGETPRGYAFYHQQDAEHGADGASLHVAYGLFGQPPSAEIGAEVAAALREQGLPVHWTGDLGQRISVPLTWWRRRTGRLAAVPPTVDDDVEVEIELLDAWTGRYAPTDGPIAATWLTSLYLPWLPTGTRLRISLGGTAITVHRDWDVLVGTSAAADRPEIRVDRQDGMALVRRLRADPASTGRPAQASERAAPAERTGPGGEAGAAGRAGLLEVTWQHSAGHEYQGVPLTRSESVDVLRRMPVRTDAWMSCRGRSRGIVQVRWEERRLWLETPDPEASASFGRYVTIPEAERMIGVLATEDRVAVAELGDLVRNSWG